MRALVPAAVCFLVLLLPSCAKEHKTAAAGRGSGPVAVVLARAEARDVADELRAVGSVQARRTVEVHARVGAPLERVAFKEGDEVREGDLLFQLDAREYQAAFDGAEANLARDAARAMTARADAQRYAELATKDYVTRSEAENLAAAAAAAAATLRADSAAVARARLDLESCTIRAPLSGRTGSPSMREGNLVKVSDDTPLVVIHQMAPIEVEFAVPERHLPEIQKRQGAAPLVVSATFPSDPSEPREGRLTFLDNQVDRTTGTVRMKATFANEDRALWPGQFVNVSLRLKVDAGAIVVPATAVQTGQKGTFVYAVKDDMTADLRTVTQGRTVDGQTVILSGIRAGDHVVIDGHLRLSPGAKVVEQPAPGKP